ncbi:MAG: hypothetical protein LBC82_07340 [Oscillospiraceae bacterium]|jgi:hypothetical protein|nr:hypothetical protein [Oscillospiraceae bacterium]
MLHEEFVKLTGVNVSLRYYKEKVEPGYNGSNNHKDDWCADWLKENKKFIVKTHLFDIEALSRDISLMDAIRAENDKMRHSMKTALEREQEAKVRTGQAEENVKLLHQRLTEKEATVNEQLQLIAGYSAELEKSNNALSSAAKSLNEKDDEILRLKAMLFDLMTKQN